MLANDSHFLTVRKLGVGEVKWHASTLQAPLGLHLGTLTLMFMIWSTRDPKIHKQSRRESTLTNS